jgi:Tfp pilus assembly protein FimT
MTAARLAADARTRVTMLATASGRGRTSAIVADARSPRAEPVANMRNRRGLTLMELLLVLVLLVVAGSLVVPAITTAFGSVKLRRAGDQVISRWTEARAQAIETGAVYQFRFTPETGDYRVEPWVSAEAATGVTATSTTSAASTASASTTSSSSNSAASEFASRATHRMLVQSSTIEAVLPNPIKFQGGQTAVDDRVRGERRVDSLQTTGESWSTPILFFPDGSASTATVVLQDDAPRYLRLTLRGLTGVARASGLMTRAELDESSRTQ